MATNDSIGDQNLRTVLYDKIVKGYADRVYKFKQAVAVSPTGAWKNFFYREQNTPLTGPTGNAIKGIPRGAEFPQAVVQWERVQTVIEKYGLEDVIHWEDMLSDDVAVRDRTLFKIAEAVAKSVDDAIWDALTENRTVVNIQSVNMTSNGTGAWNESSAAIIDNIMNAKQLIAEQNYPTDGLILFVSPRDSRSIIKYLTDKGAQFPVFSNDLARNGRVGNILGVDIIESNSVTTSYAMLCVPKRCATWKELVPMQTTTIEDQYRHVKVRAVEMGVTQVHDPKAIVLFIGTQRS